MGSGRRCEWYIACCSHFTPQRCPIEAPLVDRLSIKYVSFVFAAFHRVNSQYLLDMRNNNNSNNKKTFFFFIELTASVFDIGIMEVDFFSGHARCRGSKAGTAFQVAVPVPVTSQESKNGNILCCCWLFFLVNTSCHVVIELGDN